MNYMIYRYYSPIDYKIHRKLNRLRIKGIILECDYEYKKYKESNGSIEWRDFEIKIPLYIKVYKYLCTIPSKFYEKLRLNTYNKAIDPLFNSEINKIDITKYE